MENIITGIAISIILPIVYGFFYHLKEKEETEIKRRNADISVLAAYTDSVAVCHGNGGFFCGFACRSGGIGFCVCVRNPGLVGICDTTSEGGGRFGSFCFGLRICA